MISAAAEAIPLLEERLDQAKLSRRVGKLIDISETRLLADINDVAIGEICRIVDDTVGLTEYARVVSISTGTAVLAPLGTIQGLSRNGLVYPTGEDISFRCGDGLLGRLLDGLGRPIDGLGSVGGVRTSLSRRHLNPLLRPPIDSVLHTGLRVIDSLNTIGEGQRVGIFGDAGSGKSTLLGALARNSSADICVLAMIGERGREIREFLDRQLPPSFRGRSVMVASTSDSPAMQRILGAYVATAIAEHFRDRGRHVLLLFDSVTRFARALREVGLAAGEAAVRRGFTPSVYAELPRLIERCGRTNLGSITAAFTVLTENDGLDDPIAEEVRSLVDGHLVLSKTLAQSGHYPAIDPLQSRSRLMLEIVQNGHWQAANKIRSLMAKYREIEILVQVGEYKKGTDRVADEAIEKNGAISDFLQQSSHESEAFSATVEKLQALAGGHRG